ncbi:hypothetical protein EMPG_12817 [Blastomyces silverae]|uniref:Uncharacterized protein n=1 Tax=Blastomyces silverae TaxID=2060906 RepID=A0A0H1BL67_9EURO|nr:hypothetical protein EMPG_12817 [Blastomyces silverae]
MTRTVVTLTTGNKFRSVASYGELLVSRRIHCPSHAPENPVYLADLIFSPYWLPMHNPTQPNQSMSKEPISPPLGSRYRLTCNSTP